MLAEILGMPTLTVVSLGLLVALLIVWAVVRATKTKTG
jgi:hypothetical protein